MVLAGAVCTASYAAENMHVEDGKLLRGSSEYSFWAFDTPKVGKPGTGFVERARGLNTAAEVGGNSICLDLYGFRDGGKSLAKEGVDALQTLQDQAKGQSMGTICRVLGSDAPRWGKRRMTAVATAAEALKDMNLSVYLIEGRRVDELVKLFREHAPNLCVAAASEHADVVVVKDPKKAPEGKPILVKRALPLPGSTASCLLKRAPRMMAAVDQAKTDPIELQPWTPDNSILTEQERADGWIALFDGKTLNGWTIMGDDTGFAVKDGTIEWVKKGASYIRTRDRYDNFILKLEFKIVDGGNSGIFLRAPRACRCSRIGMEFQIMGDYGTDPHNTGTGALYDAVAPRVNASKPGGEWNAVEVTLNGSHIRALLNGQVVHDFDLDEKEVTQPRLKKGFIGLQDHSHPVSFRNIKLKPLK
jgi:3-keto-disaccharide hydrolase